MDTRDSLKPVPGRRRFARALRGWFYALGLTCCLAPGVALADTRLAAAEEETPAPMPFQLPAASASASMEPMDGSEALGLPLLLVLLSGGLVAGTLSSLFRSCAQRDLHQQPAPSQRW